MTMAQRFKYFTNESSYDVKHFDDGLLVLTNLAKPSTALFHING